jgi:AcrR family transcriptional regulator
MMGGLVGSTSAGHGDSTASPRPGRRRHHEPDAEVRLILDAALVVMRRNSYAAASVADILDEAQLSTRAFYRHFDSKDALLRAMYRRDAESVARQLRAATEAAPDPVSALQAWIDGYLGVFFDPRKAERSAVMTSEGTRRAAGYEEEERRALAELLAPLLDVLRAGAGAGVFSSLSPERDAVTIHAVATSVGAARRPGAKRFNLDAARDHVRRFCWPALGLAVELPNGADHRRVGR